MNLDYFLVTNHLIDISLNLGLSWLEDHFTTLHGFVLKQNQPKIFIIISIKS